MATWHDQQVTFTELDDTIVVGRPAFVAHFHIQEGFHQHAQSLFDAWLELVAAVDPKMPLYYSHDDTKRIMKLTKKSIAKMRGALDPSTQREGYAHYYAKNGPAKGAIDECCGFALEVCVRVEDDGYAFVALPLDWVETTGVEAVVAWFSKWCEDFGITHAGAGFGYEMAWFNEQEQAVNPTILPNALRYHGIRIFDRDHAMNRDLSANNLETVAWLTYLDDATQAKLADGAIDGIDADVTRHPGSGGVVLQAGPEPDACDTNRPSRAYELLQSVNDAIVPVRTTAWWIRWADDPDKQQRWFERMDR